MGFIDSGHMSEPSCAARRRSLRRRLKDIRRKIELAGHDLAAAQSNSPAEENRIVKNASI